MFERSLVAVAAFPEDGSSRLLYVFQVADCVEYRGMEAMAASLAEDTGIPVVGVLLNYKNYESDTVSNAQLLNVAFSVETVDAEGYERVMLRLGIMTTPALILVDSRGVVRLAAPPTKDPSVLLALRRSLEAYITTLLPE